MTRFHRVLFVLALALCLPLQTLGAITMPFCTSGGTGSTAHAMPADHSAHELHHASDAQGGVTAPVSHDCGGCGLCHLACAPVLPTAGHLTFTNGFQAVLQPTSTVAVTSFLPDPLRKPPRG